MRHDSARCSTSNGQERVDRDPGLAQAGADPFGLENVAGMKLHTSINHQSVKSGGNGSNTFKYPIRTMKILRFRHSKTLNIRSERGVVSLQSVLGDRFKLSGAMTVERCASGFGRTQIMQQGQPYRVCPVEMRKPLDGSQLPGRRRHHGEIALEQIRPARGAEHLANDLRQQIGSGAQILRRRRGAHSRIVTPARTIVRRERVAEEAFRLAGKIVNDDDGLFLSPKSFDFVERVRHLGSLAARACSRKLKGHYGVTRHVRAIHRAISYSGDYS